MAKIISMFNHKGGVSKTTTTFHLAWKLASLGKRVLMIDADPQCNLTGLTLGIGDYNSLFGFYESRRNNNIYSALAPVFGMGSGEGRTIESFETTKVQNNDNLNLLAGHIKFAEFDMLVATAVTSSSSLPMLKDLIGAFNKLIRGCADKINADIVFVDMSPSISATNMCLFMSSDYFILPTFPDFYCYQAIDSLSEVFPNWADKTASFKTAGILPKNNPKMLGVISQNYRVYGNEATNQKKMAASFQIWADKIKEITNQRLVQSLIPINMIIDKEVFTKNVDYDSPYNLANIQDLNALIAISQKLSKPVFEITEKDYGSGARWIHEQGGKKVGAKIVIEETGKVYTNMANAVMKMIN